MVDGVAGHVRGVGSTLIVESDDPSALVASARHSAGPAARHRLATIADELAERRLSIGIDGPTGDRFLTVGADARSRTLRLVTGTRHVAPGSPRALLAMVATSLSSSLRPVRRPLLATGVAATVGATLWRRGRRAAR